MTETYWYLKKWFYAFLDVYENSLSEQSDPYATDGSDEYIPSTPNQSYSSDEYIPTTHNQSGTYECEDFKIDSDTQRSKSPVINIISNIIICKRYKVSSPVEKVGQRNKSMTKLWYSPSF